MQMEKCRPKRLRRSFIEDPFAGTQGENALEEIRSQQIELYGTLCLIILILSFCYHFLTNTFIRFKRPLGSVCLRLRLNWKGLDNDFHLGYDLYPDKRVNAFLLSQRSTEQRFPIDGLIIRTRQSYG